MNNTLRKRLKTEINVNLPLRDRINLKELVKALDSPIYMDLYTLDDLTNRPYHDIKPFSPCNTIGCIAGNIALGAAPRSVKNDDELREFLRVENDDASVPDFARRILGLTYDESISLFETYFPDGPAGTLKYNREIISFVKKWLKERGVPVKTIREAFSALKNF